MQAIRSHKRRRSPASLNGAAPVTRKGISRLGLLFTVGLCVSLVSPAIATACTNEALRIGPSARLPDCRAYELVTPSDTNGLNVSEILPNFGDFQPFPTELISPSGTSVLYFTISGGWGGIAENTGNTDRYEAVRTADGWSTSRRVSPSGTQAFYAFSGGASSDHRYSFIGVGGTNGPYESGTLVPPGQEQAHYLSNPDGTFELVGLGDSGPEPWAEGRLITKDGEHIVFTTGGPSCLQGCEAKQLEPAGPPTGTAAVYERSADGSTHVVSLLPGPAGDQTPAQGEGSLYEGSSADGRVIAFKVTPDERPGYESSDGPMYVRVNSTHSEKVAPSGSTFAGISDDGTWVFYMWAGDIYAFDVGENSTERITTSEDAELVNISADGSHVYLLSSSSLDGSSLPPGEHHLYLWTQAGGIEYIATVSPDDLTSEPSLASWTSEAVNPRPADYGPGGEPSRTTPTGSVLVFESHARLTAYDNAAHIEIYRYDSATADLQCVSCNPAVESAGQDAHLESPEGVTVTAVIHNVNTDGRRVFFETPEALVGNDMDGITDIYEWTAGAGGGNGTVSLISSGHTQSYPQLLPGSDGQNRLLGITPSGEDVLFKSWEQLLPGAGEGGVLSIYDARVDGGFAEPDTARGCSGDVCQGTADASTPILTEPKSNRDVGTRRRRHRRCKQVHHRPRRRTKCKRQHDHRRKDRLLLESVANVGGRR
jgi:hypothetical protein